MQDDAKITLYVLRPIAGNLFYDVQLHLVHVCNEASGFDFKRQTLIPKVATNSHFRPYITSISDKRIHNFSIGTTNIMYFHTEHTFLIINVVQYHHCSEIPIVAYKKNGIFHSYLKLEFI